MRVARICGTCASLRGEEKALESLRIRAAFALDAYVSTWDTGGNGVLAQVRFAREETRIGLFNFTDREAIALRNTLDGECRDVNTGAAQENGAVLLGVYVMMVLAG